MSTRLRACAITTMPACTHVFMRVFSHAREHPCNHPCMCPCSLAPMYDCTYVRQHACSHYCLLVFAYTSFGACLQVFLRDFFLDSLHAWHYAPLLFYSQSSLEVFLSARILSCMSSCLHVYMSTCIRTCSYARKPGVFFPGSLARSHVSCRNRLFSLSGPEWIRGHVNSPQKRMVSRGYKRGGGEDYLHVFVFTSFFHASLPGRSLLSALLCARGSSLYVPPGQETPFCPDITCFRFMFWVKASCSLFQSPGASFPPGGGQGTLKAPHSTSWAL